ncbi:MAG: zinc ribbon domain-containing protein [Nanoarchaeota archaeon]
MIGKFSKKCENCDEKVKRNFEFCPFCGYNFNLNSKFNKASKLSNKDDYGFLGKSDVLENNSLFNGGINSMLGGLINELNKQMTELDKELKDENKNKKRRPMSGFSISIETNGNGPVKIRTFGGKPNGLNLGQNMLQNVEKIKRLKLPKIDSDKLVSLRKLPRKEAEASVRRLADKIIYELEIPGVKSIENVNINVVQGMVEVKAISNKEVFIKELNVNYPLQGYSFGEGKLVLDFASE